MKSVLTPLAKSVLISLSLSSGISAADAAVQKKNLWIKPSFESSFTYSSINNFKWRNKRYNENN